MGVVAAALKFSWVTAAGADLWAEIRGRLCCLVAPLGDGGTAEVVMVGLGVGVSSSSVDKRASVA